MYQLPSMPDTTLSGTQEDSYSAGGLTLEVVEAMKTWRIVFDGKLRLCVTVNSMGTSLVVEGVDSLLFPINDWTSIVTTGTILI